MKKIFSIIIALCFIVIAVALFPAKHVPQDDNSLPFNAYCPSFINALPSSTLVWVLHKESGKNSYLPAQHMVCPMDIIMNRMTAREKTDDSKILRIVAIADVKSKKFYPYIFAHNLVTPYIRKLLKENRPDLAAYFMHRMVERGSNDTADDLAQLYVEGKGVAKDDEMAKHLYRLDLISYYFLFKKSNTGKAVVKSPDECSDNFDHLFKYANSMIELNQVKWCQSLCYKTNEELYNIADWYLSDNNIYAQTEIAHQILSALHVAKKYKKAKILLNKITEK